jgi:hypothetical protein
MAITFWETDLNLGEANRLAMFITIPFILFQSSINPRELQKFVLKIGSQEDSFHKSRNSFLKQFLLLLYNFGTVNSTISNFLHSNTGQFIFRLVYELTMR